MQVTLTPASNQMKPPKHVSPTRCLLFLVLLATLIAAPYSSQARPKSSGLSGQVLLHNGLVATFGRPTASIHSFPASLRVYSTATGEFIVAVTTDAVGRFQVALPPGDYRVVPNTMYRGQALEPGQSLALIGPYEDASPLDVAVHAHRLTRLAIIYEEHMGN